MATKAFQRIYTKLDAITKATVSLKAKGISNDELAVVGGRLAQVVKTKGDLVTLQVFSGTEGIPTDAEVTFLGEPPTLKVSDQLAGRFFNAYGAPIDGGPEVEGEEREIGGPSVNPYKRRQPSELIPTGIAGIDLGRKRAFAPYAAHEGYASIGAGIGDSEHRREKTVLQERDVKRRDGIRPSRDLPRKLVPLPVEIHAAMARTTREHLFRLRQHLFGGEAVQVMDQAVVRQDLQFRGRKDHGHEPLRLAREVVLPRIAARRRAAVVPVGDIGGGNVRE